MGLQPGSVENVVGPSRQFWAGRRVLITGHTGFKGAWLWLLLESLGAEVSGIALPPHTNPSLFELAGLANITIVVLPNIGHSATMSALLIADHAAALWELSELLVGQRFNP